MITGFIQKRGAGIRQCSTVVAQVQLGWTNGHIQPWQQGQLLAGLFGSPQNSHLGTCWSFILCGVGSDFSEITASGWCRFRTQSMFGSLTVTGRGRPVLGFLWSTVSLTGFHAFCVHLGPRFCFMPGDPHLAVTVTTYCGYSAQSPFDLFLLGYDFLHFLAEV